MKKAGILLLLLLSNCAFAGGGTWKMGPFGPYWDDNDWPEFTPMYWMEEFMNSIDDDDELMDWMRLNQNQNQRQIQVSPPIANFPGNGPMSAYNYPRYNAFSNPMNSPMGNPMDYYGPSNRLGNSRMPWQNNRSMRPDNAHNWQRYERSGPRNSRRYGRRQPYQPRLRDYSNLPDLSQEEFDRMPRDYQTEYMRALRGMTRTMDKRRSRNRH